MFTSIREPQTTQEWLAYYDLRWRVLRAPWQQPRGSEKDELEQNAVHQIIINHKQQIIAIGRLHQLDDTTAQIRYMAVEPGYERQGFAKKILYSLEQKAKNQGIKKIILHAREDAAGFYQRQGYKQVKASHTLFGMIKHFLMEKSLYN